MKLYIFDVSNVFYRAFWGNDSLTTSYGMPVQGLHGFVRMVQGIIRDHRPDLVAFAMEGFGEGGGQSARKLIDPLYKANRAEIPEELRLQLEKLPEIMHVMGYPTFRAAGYEADDMISTLVKRSLEQGLEPVIVSSDKDFCQLVKGPVKMFNISKGEMVDELGVYRRYGVRADQFLDYLSIIGDTSDNVKGVKGIGPKGAVDLLTKYDNLDNVYRNLDAIKGAKQKNLIESREQVYKARSLVSFMDAPLVADLRTVCNWAGPRKDECRALFRKLEFRELESMVLGSEVVNVGGVEIGVRK